MNNQVGRPTKQRTINLTKPIKVTHNNLGSIFLSLRQERYHLQEEEAKVLGVSTATVHNWECNVSRPTLDFLIDILEFHGYKLIVTKES